MVVIDVHLQIDNVRPEVNVYQANVFFIIVMSLIETFDLPLVSCVL